MYRIMLGEEEMPTTKLEKSNRYSYKVITKAIDYAKRNNISFTIVEPKKNQNYKENGCQK